ncbi:MAG: hypothetical protein LBV48_02330 [Mycoplasmataceae bacterium]|nr:hypothetical protein [Mycoplasmataceae bacterium]
MVKQAKFLIMISTTLILSGASAIAMLATSCKGDDMTPATLTWDELKSGMKLTTIYFTGFEQEFQSFTYDTTLDRSEVINFKNSNTKIETLYDAGYAAGKVTVSFPEMHNVLSYETTTQEFHDAWSENNFSWDENHTLALQTPMTIASIDRSVDSTLYAFFQTSTFDCLI